MSEVSVHAESIIKVMPGVLANKIAAGEVVQRPASAAKELIENALDAGADHITLNLKAAGRELIQVIDDGCGMGPQDAAVCFTRHATSKIRSIDDLERVQTLGFRGEALASIAAVAQVELRTKRVKDAAGHLIRIDGGTVGPVEPCATPNGTAISVRNLFFNVPARRNFLKTPATEFKHLIETFQFLALSNPHVGFILNHDGNEVYRLTAAPEGDIYDKISFRIADLFGENYREQLVPVGETTSYLSLYGFVGTPTFHRRSRGEQFLFVNGRYVKNRYLDHAVAAAYEATLPQGAYPFFTLFLDLDPKHVDVNVHPTKAEVKFDDERGVYGFLRAVVKKALGTADLTPQFLEGEALPPSSLGTSPDDSFAPKLENTPRPITFDRNAEHKDGGWGHSALSNPTSASRQSSLPWSPGELSAQLFSGNDPQEGGVIASGATQDGTDEKAPSAQEQLLWQLHDAYILTQIRSGLIIIDQKASHERILYEKTLQSLNDGFGLSQQLLFPHTLDFNQADYELLKELLPDLLAIGFDLELFSGRSIVIRGVPTDIIAGDERNILEDILDQYKSNRDKLKIKGRDNLAKSIAKRSAISHGYKLTIKAMRTMIDQLFLCEMPYACPNGRPTMVKISMEELIKRFGRTPS